MQFLILIVGGIFLIVIGLYNLYAKKVVFIDYFGEKQKNYKKWRDMSKERDKNWKKEGIINLIIGIILILLYFIQNTFQIL